MKKELPGANNIDNLEDKNEKLVDYARSRIKNIPEKTSRFNFCMVTHNWKPWASH